MECVSVKFSCGKLNVLFAAALSSFTSFSAEVSSPLN